MSYYNYSDNRECNGSGYSRDPRLVSGAAGQYNANVADTQNAYNYGAYAEQSYSNQYAPSSTAPSYHSHPHPQQAHPDPNQHHYPHQSTTNTTYPYYPSATTTTHTTATPYYPPTTHDTPPPTYSHHHHQYNNNQSYASTHDNYNHHHQQEQQQQQQQQQQQPIEHYVYDLSYPDELEESYDSTSTAAAAARSDEELWVESWLARLGKIQLRLDSAVVVDAAMAGAAVGGAKKGVIGARKGGAGRVGMKVGEARTSLSKAMKVLSAIETIHSHLHAHLSTLSSDEWRHCTVQIGALRDELSVLMTPFEADSGNAMAVLRRLVCARRKKRANEKRRRMERREERDREREERDRRHEAIDEWLERERGEVLRMEEEEAAKTESDIILADTTRRKVDAKRNLALVQALTKLRAVREKAAQGRGEQTSAQDSYAFQELAERLQDIWTNALKEYGKEEHRLRTQLEQTTSEDQRKAKVEKEKQVTDDWSQALFGEPLKDGEESGLYLGLTAAERNVDTFIAIRKSWDTFLSKSDDPEGTKIPIGWVLPKEHASDKWAQYLVSNLG